MTFVYTVLALILIYCIASLFIIQPLSAIIRLIVAKRKDSKYAIGLKRYLVAIISLFTYTIIGAYYDIKINQFQAILNIASIFAILFGYWFHIIKWHYKFKRIKAYDKMIILKSVQRQKQFEERIITKPRYYLHENLNSVIT